MGQNRITLQVLPDDIEHVLRTEAYNAAKYSAFVDYFGPRTYEAPTIQGETIADAKVRWQAWFLRAKRIVEAFGVEVELTSEQETMTVYTPPKPGTGRTWVPDDKNRVPAYRREVHSQACHAAASRVVRRWREAL